MENWINLGKTQKNLTALNKGDSTPFFVPKERYQDLASFGEILLFLGMAANGDSFGV